jgi:glutamine amidotransferase
MIAIVNYGMGNLGSVLNMLKYIGVEAKVTDNKKDIQNSEKLILPGVGSFDKAMEKINSTELREVLDEQALIKQKPILGICLGMQLLTRGSKEGIIPGFGWINAEAIRFPDNLGIRIPHMGWNNIHPSTPSLLTKNLNFNSRFYFVHSYRVHVDKPENSILTCNYGVNFEAAIQRDNIFGVQFHPEKSHKFGMQLLKNFTLI